MRSRRAAVVLKSIDKVLPLAFSSCGFSSSTAAFTPLEASTRISAASACTDPNSTRVLRIAPVVRGRCIMFILVWRIVLSPALMAIKFQGDLNHTYFLRRITGTDHLGAIEYLRASDQAV